MPELREHLAWVVVSPAQSVQGEWVAHCLDLDVVSQGRSLDHALEMIEEAVKLVVDEDCRAGRDPLSRRAPPTEWNIALFQPMKDAELEELETIKRLAREGKISWMATQLDIRYRVAEKAQIEAKAQAMMQHACAAA